MAVTYNVRYTNTDDVIWYDTAFVEWISEFITITYLEVFLELLVAKTEQALLVAEAEQALLSAKAEQSLLTATVSPEQQKVEVEVEFEPCQ